MSSPNENGIAVCPVEMNKISCYSQVLTEKFSHTWKLNEFNRIPFIAKYPIFSPNFTLGKRSDSLWQVVMTKHLHCPNKKKSDEEDDSDGEGDEEVDLSMEIDLEQDHPESDSTKCGKLESENKSKKIKRIGLRLVKIDETSTWEVVKYYFTIQTSDGFKHTTEIKEEAGTSDYESKPMYTYITEKDFKGKDIFEEPILKLTCHITFKYIEGNPFEAPEVYEGRNCADDLKLLYNSKKFSDVVLVVEGAEISAHKSILCARAYAFEGMLDENKEAPKQKLDLKVDEEVGRALIGFIYCGGIREDFPVNKCLELYEAAQMYGVTNLKKLCSKYFKNHLDDGVCRKCLDIDEHPEDCLEVVKKLGVKRVKRILSKLETCNHKSVEAQKS